jgi:hypothetical protein
VDHGTAFSFGEPGWDDSQKPGQYRGKPPLNTKGVMNAFHNPLILCG